MEVIETPEFKRLKDISFLGVLGYCCPNNHELSTRYEHSLSVASKCHIYADKKNFPSQEKIYFVLAGLLHDLGHCGFSHSLEPVFIEKFSITHHNVTSQLILSAPNLVEIWDKYDIDAKKIADTIEGHSDHRNKVVTKMCVNFDTLDGMVRTEEHFSDSNNARGVCDQLFILMCNEDNWEKHVADFDAFWHLKDNIYDSYIYGEKFRIIELLFQELLMEETLLRADHYYLSDSEMLNEFPWIDQFVKDIKNNFELGFVNDALEKVKEFRDMVETSVRRFRINPSKDFSLSKNKRYSVSEEIKVSHL
jgi:hypothetical protein